MFATLAVFLLSIYASIGTNAVLTESVLPAKNSLVSLGTSFVVITFNGAFTYLVTGIWIAFAFALIWILKEEIGEALRRFDEWRHRKPMEYKPDCIHFVPVYDKNGTWDGFKAICNESRCMKNITGESCKDCQKFLKQEKE